MIEPPGPDDLERRSCMVGLLVGLACWAVLVLAGIGAWDLAQALWP